MLTLVELSRKNNITQILDRYLHSILLKKTLWPLFYGWGSTASRLKSHYEEAVCFLPLKRRKDERLSRSWSNPAVLNMGPLDWESS